MQTKNLSVNIENPLTENPCCLHHRNSSLSSLVVSYLAVPQNDGRDHHFIRSQSPKTFSLVLLKLSCPVCTRQHNHSLNIPAVFVDTLCWRYVLYSGARHYCILSRRPGVGFKLHVIQVTITRQLLHYCIQGRAAPEISCVAGTSALQPILLIAAPKARYNCRNLYDTFYWQANIPQICSALLLVSQGTDVMSSIIKLYLQIQVFQTVLHRSLI